ncbi:MAG: hypothetical protein ACUVTX_12200 [Bacteroidales bacterium]
MEKQPLNINTMASIRQLKKDIDNQIFSIISDCLLFMSMHPEHDAGEVSTIVHEAVALRNNLITRIHHPEKKNDAKEIKNHFRAIKADLTEGIDRLCLKLSSLSSKKKKK